MRFIFIILLKMLIICFRCYEENPSHKKTSNKINTMLFVFLGKV